MSTGHSLECRNGVLLRAPRLADAEAIAKHANNREVWLNLRDVMPHPYSVADAREFIDRVKEEAPRLLFSIDLKGEVVGGIGLVPGTDIERYSAEVGYWLGPQYWSRGIATAALERICRYGFDELGLLRVFAMPIAWNAASFRVLEKAGFQREGIMRNACVKDGKVVDMVLYAKVAERRQG
ncbi:MAG TPA: GNAT family protein [Candidatus Cybelea sp.]|jgi:RimJ/RimL family protein N-acetyltransferase